MELARSWLENGHEDMARSIIIKLINDSDNIQKSHADYSLLDERGIIRIGSIVQRNTVLISKVVLVNRKEDKYIDKSIFYKHDEPMEVDDVDVTYYNPQASIIESVKILEG